MKNGFGARLLRSSYLATLLVASPALAGTDGPTQAATVDYERQADSRAKALLAQMTLDEKIAMLNGHFGSVLRKEHPQEMRIGAGFVPGVPRLGIPDLLETDGALGIGNGGFLRPGDVATAMPAGLAIAASFDPALAYQGGAMMGSEARSKGFNVLLAGGVNLTRDAWNGRNFEYFGEDPLLSGIMAGESIRGIQFNRIAATVKHLALNSQESGRYVLDAQIPEPALRESDLLAFQIAIERGRPASVMCAYNKVNAFWSCENPFLLTRVLRDDWRYKGWVMSDWGAVHSTVGAAMAGLDQQSGQELDAKPFFGKPLLAAVKAGTVPVTRIDEMVHRILRSSIAVGVFDNPPPTVPEPIDYAAHAKVALKAAESGIVLLRNEGGILPLSAKAKSIVVIGAHAQLGVLSGGGSSQVQPVAGAALRTPIGDGFRSLSFIKRTWMADAPLAAIRSRAPDAQVTFLDGSDLRAAAFAAKQADVAIVFGEQWRTEALDLESLALPDNQDALIARVAASNPRTIVVLQTGGAVLMPWLDKVGAVIEAWYPGDRGAEAIARVLFGEVDARGRLPLTFPASAEQLPRPTIPGLANVKQALVRDKAAVPLAEATTVDITGGVAPFSVAYKEGSQVGYRWFAQQGAKPLFPFGYGLSYTRFAYDDFRVETGATTRVSFTVRNVGTRSGTAVPQIYVDLPATKQTVTSHRLVGFNSVELAKGQTKRVSIDIDQRLLGWYDPTTRSFKPATAGLVFSLANDALDTALTCTVRIRSGTAGMCQAK